MPLKPLWRAIMLKLLSAVWVFCSDLLAVFTIIMYIYVPIQTDTSDCNCPIIGRKHTYLLRNNSHSSALHDLFIPTLRYLCNMRHVIYRIPVKSFGRVFLYDC